MLVSINKNFVAFNYHVDLNKNKFLWMVIRSNSFMDTYAAISDQGMVIN